MSSLLNKARDKVEQVLQKDSNQTDNPHSSNAGPHSSNAMNKVDPTIDSDRDHRNDPTSRVGGYGSTQTGPGVGGGVAHSDTYGSANANPGYNDPRSTNTGPHGSNIVNKLDPRVDSDNDNRNDPTSRAGGYGNTQQYGDNFGQAGGPGGVRTTDTGYGHTGTTGHAATVGHTGTTGNTGYAGTGSSGYDDPRSTNDGPHRSNFANKLDPRVDSDRDGGYGHTQPYSGGAPAHTQTTATTGYGADPIGHGAHAGHGGAVPHAGAAGTTGYGGASSYDDPRSTNTGPHGSNLANKVDPRVDSDRDNRNDPTSRVGGYGTQHESYGAGPGTGYGEPGAGGYGAGHNVGAPGGYGSGHNVGAPGGYGDSSYTPGSGNANKTAGPHDSNILNKLDPRVDSDLDGSKTYGGNQTHR